MWHEKFTQDEIETICTDEAIRSAPSDDKAEARIKEIKTAVHTLAARMPDQKPARFPGSRPPGSAKVPKDRTMADSLVNDMGRDNLAYFTGVAHHWNGHQWVRIAQLDNPAGPLAQIYNSLMQENPEANHSLIKSAMAMFSNCIEMREAAPDHSSIPFKNGLLDVHSRRLRPITRDEYIIQHIPFDYDPGADCPLWRAFMRHLFEPPLEFEYETPKARFEDWDRAINAAEEFFGYCLTRSHAMQKMLYVIGKPDTGKSVLFKVLRGLLPKQWVSTVSLETFDDPNSLVQMVGSYINIASEVGRRSRDVDDVLLRVTAGEDVTVKLLFQNKFQAILPTRLIFQGNLPPDTTDGTGAIQRRILMLRTTDSPPNKKIEDYDRIILKEAKGILNRLVAAYARLLERGQFESPNYSKQLVEDMKTESNSALYWAKEVCRDPNPGEENTQNEELFDHYIEYCTRLNLYKMSSIMWGKQLTAAGWPTVRKRGAGGNVIRTRALVFKSTMVRGNSY
jgi:putative DNA primase/helicase